MYKCACLCVRARRKIAVCKKLEGVAGRLGGDIKRVAEVSSGLCALSWCAHARLEKVKFLLKKAPPFLSSERVSETLKTGQDSGVYETFTCIGCCPLNCSTLVPFDCIVFLQIFVSFSIFMMCGIQSTTWIG